MRNRLYARIHTGVAAFLIILLYSMVFRFSAMPADLSTIQSMTATQRFIEIVENWLSIDLPFNNSSAQLNELDGFVRKAAHFTEYALLGLLTYSIAICWNYKKTKGTVYSFLFVVTLAAADEIHQTFVPGRSGSLRDVLLDSTGIIAGILVLKILDGLYTRHRARAGRTH